MSHPIQVFRVRRIFTHSLTPSPLPPRPGPPLLPLQGSQDLYVFGCGSDYRACLADFVAVAGPMALPPVSALGVWWSRHWGNPHNLPWGNEYFGPMTEENIMTKVNTLL